MRTRAIGIRNYILNQRPPHKKCVLKLSMRRNGTVHNMKCGECFYPEKKGFINFNDTIKCRCGKFIPVDFTKACVVLERNTRGRRNGLLLMEIFNPASRYYPITEYKRACAVHCMAYRQRPGRSLHAKALTNTRH